MRLLAVLVLLASAAATPEPRYFQFQRAVTLPAPAPQACLAADASLFARAAADLSDVRLYRGAQEVPFAMYSGAASQGAAGNIPVLNSSSRNGATEFDAAMPAGRYADLDLALTGQDFLATVTVSGSRSAGEPPTRQLGSYTVFDFTREKLGRSTVLHLPPSDLGYLHFRVSGPLAPDAITGLSATSAAATAPAHALVAATSSTTQHGHLTSATFNVPAHVPVDRVVFEPASEPVNFSRPVTVRVTPAQPADEEAEQQSTATFSGTLLRLHGTRDGRKIDEERLSVGTRGQQFAAATTWTVEIDNGDDQPPQLHSIRLEMLQRDLCFQPAGASGYTLRYGDTALAAPHYDYASLFSRSDHAAQATAGPEQPNPIYQPRPDTRPFTERHPALLWTALLLVIGILGTLAVRSRTATTDPGQAPR